MNEGKATCGKPSRGRYRQGCRCLKCRAANADYSRSQAHGEASEHPLVGERETAEARARVEGWLAQGVGLRAVELWTGVWRSTLNTLLKGRHPHAKGATKRLSKEAYDAIMGCGEVRPLPMTPVDSAPARAAIDRLLASGWTKVWIAEESGVPYQTLVAVHTDRRGTGKCSAKTRDAVVALASPRKGKSAKRLEGWQWQEARADYQRGVAASVLAERYGVTEWTVQQHMKRHGVKVVGSVRTGTTAGKSA